MQEKVRLGARKSGEFGKGKKGGGARDETPSLPKHPRKRCQRDREVAAPNREAKKPSNSINKSNFVIVPPSAPQPPLSCLQVPFTELLIASLPRGHASCGGGSPCHPPPIKQPVRPGLSRQPEGAPTDLRSDTRNGLRRGLWVTPRHPEGRPPPLPSPPHPL